MKKIPGPIKKTAIALIIVFLLGSFWMTAFNHCIVRAETRTVTRTVYSSYPVPEPYYIEVEKPVPVVNTVEVEKPVYIDREIEVIHEVITGLKDWDSPEQLTEFLKNDDTDTWIFLKAGSSGEITFNGQCEDLALQLRDRAMAIGRYLSVQVLNPKEYEKWYGIAVGPDVYHAICMARIGNGFWYIEPSNDKHWLALNLD